MGGQENEKNAQHKQKTIFAWKMLFLFVKISIVVKLCFVSCVVVYLRVTDLQMRPSRDFVISV